MKRAFSLMFPDCTVSIETNYEKYAKYLLFYFKNIISEKKDAAACVHVSVLWEENYHDPMAHAKSQKGYAQIGANTVVHGKSVYALRKVARKSKVVHVLSSESGQVIAENHIQWKGMKDTIRSFFSGSADENHFFNLTYPCVYYPLFWYYGQVKKRYVLHSSLVTYEKKSILLCGLEGIGKTSLGLGLMQHEPVTPFSDNLVFFDATSVYPCYELIRICTDDATDVYEKHIEKANTFSASKDFYAPRYRDVSGGLRPQVLIFPYFSDAFTVRKLTTEEAVRRALVTSYIPSELSLYQEYRSLYNATALSYDPEKEEKEVLSTVLKKVTCLEVGMKKAEGLKANIEKVKKVIRDI